VRQFSERKVCAIRACPLYSADCGVSRDSPAVYPRGRESLWGELGSLQSENESLGDPSVSQIQSDLVNGQLRTPTKIPQKVQMIKEEEAPPPEMATGGVVGGVPGGIPGGQMGGVIGGIISSTPVAVPKVATPQRVRVSLGVSQGLLIKKVQPNYPPLARQARIQGTVLLQAEISKDGAIENLRLISGHPMLAPAAIEAVKQWRYKPYMLNGEPVAVETQVQVNFTLSGG